MKNKLLPALVITVLVFIIFIANLNAQAQTGSEWSQLIPQTAPVARAYHSMAYNGDSVVMYGGGPHQDWSTYEYADGEWAQYVTTEYPYINYAVMAYDELHEEIVLFAGSVTWIWKDSDWIAYNPENYPSPRYFPSMAYDPSMDQIILFGGEAAGVMMDDMWAWDRDNETWESVDQNGQRPSARWSAGMAYDGQDMVLYGGGTRFSHFDDTWLWNGDESTWAQADTLSGPGPRQGLSMAYDDVSKKVFLFGGCVYPIECYGDLWVWDGTSSSWSPRNTLDGPEARAYAAMTAQSDGRLVLFGGVDLYQKTFKDTWEWDETSESWIETIPTQGPIGANYSGIAYDTDRGEAILFGGEVWPGAGLTSMGETWIWDSVLGAWSKPDLSNGKKPSPRGGQGMAYYEGGGYTLLFGGAQHSQWPGGEICRNDTWRWDGAEWFEFDPEAPPPCRWSAGMTYYDDADSVVLFGGWQGTSGTQRNDMWEWKDAEWMPLESSADYPEPRFGLAMAYDSERHRIVLFGGTDVNDNRLRDTWEYYAGQWHEVITENAPPSSAYNRMVFDKTSDRIVILGYQAGGMWEYDGTDWTFMMDGVDNPSARNGSAIVYDETRGSILLFGGNMLDDTWEYGTPILNHDPILTIDNQTVPIEEGQTAENSGTVYDPDGDPITLGASVGTITDLGDGTWSWTFSSSDGPDDSQLVTITADDGRGGHASNTFSLSVSNIPPVVGAGPDVSLILGEVFYGNGSFYDAGQDSWSATVDYSAGQGSVPLVLYGTAFELNYEYAEPGEYFVVVTVMDDDGGVGTDDLVVVVQSTVEAIQDLCDLVESYDLDHGINNSLITKLNAAIQILEDGNEDNDVAAINNLEAFINAVEAQRGKNITNEQAELLINAAQRIIDTF